MDRVKFYGQVKRVKGYMKQRGEKLLCLIMKKNKEKGEGKLVQKKYVPEENMTKVSPITSITMSFFSGAKTYQYALKKAFSAK